MNNNNPAPEAMAGGIIFPIIILAAYIYSAYALYKIAEKTNTASAWLAFIPILNVVLMLQIARKSLWWLLAMLVPLVNIGVLIWIWMKIAEERRRPAWWGILMIIGPINLILLWFLAFREAPNELAPAQSHEITTTPPTIAS